MKKKVRLINTFYQDTEIREISPELIQSNLAAIFFKRWSNIAISNLNNRRFRKHVQFENLEIFKKYYDQGKGVIILDSHYGIPGTAISIFPRLGYTDFHTIVDLQNTNSKKFTGINQNIKVKTLSYDKFSDAELFKLLLKTKHTLKEGGIIHLLGDGYDGKSSITLPFIGKLRDFRGSYAELALSTNAQVIPVFITANAQGKVKVALQKPLNQGTEDQSREERTAHMIRQYVDLLTEKWKSDPQYIHWGHMEKYLHHISVDR